MNYEEILNKAIEFAQIIHQGQTRKDRKTPYFSHVIAAMRISTDLYKKEVFNKFLDSYNNYLLIIQLLTLLHDGAEDTKKYKNQECLLVNDLLIYIDHAISGDMVDKLINGLKLLNKNRYNNYLEYVSAIKEDFFATYAKRGDLKHNMSDLQEGSLKDKYRLAEYILTH